MLKTAGVASFSSG